MTASPDVTQALADLPTGDPAAIATILPAVYDDLRTLARKYLTTERADHTLQPTALVHEVILKLAGQRQVRWQNRTHFFAVAAQAMRRVLVDYARRHHAQKRGAGQRPRPLDAGPPPSVPPVDEVIAMHDALEQLSRVDEVQGQIVELRYFGGLTIEETAVVVGVSSATVKREWAMAKAWLYRQLKSD